MNKTELTGNFITICYICTNLVPFANISMTQSVIGNILEHTHFLLSACTVDKQCKLRVHSNIKYILSMVWCETKVKIHKSSLIFVFIGLI